MFLLQQYSTGKVLICGAAKPDINNWQGATKRREREQCKSEEIL